MKHARDTIRHPFPLPEFDIRQNKHIFNDADLLIVSVPYLQKKVSDFDETR